MSQVNNLTAFPAQLCLFSLHISVRHNVHLHFIQPCALFTYKYLYYFSTLYRAFAIYQTSSKICASGTCLMLCDEVHISFMNHCLPFSAMSVCFPFIGFLRSVCLFVVLFSQPNSNHLPLKQKRHSNPYQNMGISARILQTSQKCDQRRGDFTMSFACRMPYPSFIGCVVVYEFHSNFQNVQKNEVRKWCSTTENNERI